MNNQKQTLKEASQALKEASSIMDSMIQHYCQNAWNRIDPCQYERQMMNWASIAESIQETHEKADQPPKEGTTKQENTMNNLYQALSKQVKNAKLAHESGNEEALVASLYNLDCICSNLKKEVDQTTPAPPTKLVLITYQSYKEEVIPYSIEALDFVAAHHDCIDSIRIVELRSL